MFVSRKSQLPFILQRASLHITENLFLEHKNAKKNHSPIWKHENLIIMFNFVSDLKFYYY